MSARDPVFQTYLQSILRIDVLGGPVEVRPEEQDAAAGPWPFADTVHIVSAWNPNNELVSDEQNDRSHKRLLRDVRRLEIPSMAALAMAKDQSGTWRAIKQVSVTPMIPASSAGSVRYRQPRG